MKWYISLSNIAIAIAIAIVEQAMLKKSDCTSKALKKAVSLI